MVSVCKCAVSVGLANGGKRLYKIEKFIGLMDTED